jgi:guanylate kinase
MTLVYIISAPSGSGKSTLVTAIKRLVDRLDFSVSYTTRAPRGSEEDGRDYYYTSREVFERMIGRGEFLEYADVFGDYYGTAKKFLDDAIVRGNDLLLDIDVQGASQIMRRIPDAVSIFILPPDWQTLESRLRNRGSDAEEVIRRRLDTARREIENYSKYDYILINNLLEQSTQQLKDIVLAERLQRSGQALSEEQDRLVKTAQACQLEQARERVQPILASFKLQMAKST